MWMLSTEVGCENSSYWFLHPVENLQPEIFYMQIQSKQQRGKVKLLLGQE